jgi:glycosyltransferase involved in cell wall biosynthesis
LNASKPAVSVVIPTRNRRPRLAALLDSLAVQTLGPERFEAIVVDDGSLDDTAGLLADAAKNAPFRVQVLAGRQLGPAAARNDGWRRASAPLVAFTDDDCEATPEWLEEMVRAAADRPDDIVQGRTLPQPRDSERRGVFARTKRIESGPGPWFQTCNIAYPRALLERLGGFDESFGRPFGEDADLGWRALEAGARAGFAADAMVHHAVELQSPIEFLRGAVRDPDEALIFKRHAGLRDEVRVAGIFKARSHAYLSGALAGLFLARRHPAALLLALPYAGLLAARARALDAAPQELPYLAGYDALEMASAVRGAIRHRVAAL